MVHATTIGIGTASRSPIYTPAATTLASHRARLGISRRVRILPLAKSPRRPARRDAFATARELWQDFPPLSIMHLRRCCGAAWAHSVLNCESAVGFGADQRDRTLKRLIPLGSAPTLIHMSRMPVQLGYVLVIQVNEAPLRSAPHGLRRRYQVNPWIGHADSQARSCVRRR